MMAGATGGGVRKQRVRRNVAISLLLPNRGWARRDHRTLSGHFAHFRHFSPTLGDFYFLEISYLSGPISPRVLEMSYLSPEPDF